MIAVGVDGCRAGWVCVALDNRGLDDVAVIPSLDEIVRRWPTAGAVGVDIPIGLPEPGRRRRADVAARAFVGTRRSSVFLTPPREMLTCAYEEARLHGVSQQAYGLRSKILEAEAAAMRDRRLVEVHPEVSFAALAGRPLEHSKYAWNGVHLRVRLLRAAGIKLPEEVDPRAPAVDVVDAAAAAWSAFRVARGEAVTLPSDPAPGEPTISY